MPITYQIDSARHWLEIKVTGTVTTDEAAETVRRMFADAAYNDELSGVIDWGGLVAGDPAVELMVAWNLFDVDSRSAYRDALGFVDDAMWLRGRAWAASAAIQALPYYRDTNPDIVARSWRVVGEVLAGG